MTPPSYVRSVVDRNVFMRRMTVYPTDRVLDLAPKDLNVLEPWTAQTVK
jgi:hypothetical protein